MPNRSRLGSFSLALMVLFLSLVLIPALPLKAAHADSEITTVPVGNAPLFVGVDPSTNMVYVSNYNSNTTSVIDGATNTIAATIPVGGGPAGIGVNPKTNRVYVGNTLGRTISVIDATTNMVIDTVL